MTKESSGDDPEKIVANTVYIGTALARLRAAENGRSGGGSGGDMGDMNERITRLETHNEYTRIALTEIKGDLKSVMGSLSALPTKRDLINYNLTGLGVAIAVIAIIIGGLGWLETRASRVQPAPAPVASSSQPIVIQLPVPARGRH